MKTAMTPNDSFEDRRDAGRRLADKLKPYANQPDVIVLALPRGGVPVAFEVATALGVPMDVFIVRKIGVPGHPELAMGAIASGGSYHLNEDIIRQLYIPKAAIESVIEKETEELKRREGLYRLGREPLELKNRRVILIDDGLATGASMLAAIHAVREMNPKELIVAIPVIAASSISDIEPKVDRLVYVLSPYQFYAVGEWYAEFGQTTDEEVKELLERANHTESAEVRSLQYGKNTRRPSID